MKRILSIWIILLAMIGCATERKCRSRFPCVAETIIRDSVITEIKYRDTIIYIHIPGQTVKDTVSIPCPEPPKPYIPDTAKAETPLARAKAWWSYPSVKLELVQKDTTIEQRLKDAIMLKNMYRMLYEKERQAQKVVKETPKWRVITSNFGILVFLSILIFLGIKFGKK